MEDIIPGRKRIRFMEADAAHGGRNRKRHLNVIVERGVVIALTEVAVEMRVQFAQASEALDNVGAHWTDQQPVHVEQPNHAGMEEKVDLVTAGHAPMIPMPAMNSRRRMCPLKDHACGSLALSRTAVTIYSPRARACIRACPWLGCRRRFRPCLVYPQ